MRRLPLLLAACLLGGLSGCSVFEGGALGRKYVVFFSTGSAALDRPARNVVSDAADAAADNPALDIQVAGYSAAHGSVSADEQLSARRADVVASALRADGVAANRIQVRPRAPSNEDPGVGARRVEIDFSR
jgi:outer membrane protein OmpA-like peptidoglycan-associated protein